MLCGGMSGGAAGGAAGGAGGAGGSLGCYEACLEVDESTIQHADHWVYKGKGQGSYEQKSSMEFMGAGRGAYEREVMKSSARCRPACLAVGCCGLLVLLGLLAFFLFYRPEVGQSEVGPDCVTDYHDWQHLWTMERRSLCRRQVGRGCAPQEQDVVKVAHVPCHSLPTPITCLCLCLAPPIHTRSTTLTTSIRPIM
ncbi:unnamed protein product [Effrenium voratum]|uniref:Uncharacterized protein n=1 Tax=Effrenium voratum TaxID=2562239 RepID=A0AA36I280_9DINO|nr:unnamed protein product [Effrenium voratum]